MCIQFNLAVPCSAPYNMNWTYYEICVSVCVPCMHSAEIVVVVVVALIMSAAQTRKNWINRRKQASMRTKGITKHAYRGCLPNRTTHWFDYRYFHEKCAICLCVSCHNILHTHIATRATGMNGVLLRYFFLRELSANHHCAYSLNCQLWKSIFCASTTLSEKSLPT